jgi:hypothetical protein
MHGAWSFDDLHPSATASPRPVESPRALKAITMLSRFDAGEAVPVFDSGVRAVAQPSESRRTIDL